MIDKNIEKLETKFFKFFVPEKCYIRYQLSSPYYMQAPSKERLVEIINEYKDKKIKIYNVWYNHPSASLHLIQIEEIVANLCRNRDIKIPFQNGLDYFMPDGDCNNGFYYEKSGICTMGMRSIQIGGKTRIEALLKLCLDENIRDFIKEDIRRLFCEK